MLAGMCVHESHPLRLRHGSWVCAGRKDTLPLTHAATSKMELPDPYTEASASQHLVSLWVFLMLEGKTTYLLNHWITLSLPLEGMNKLLPPRRKEGNKHCCINKQRSDHASCWPGRNPGDDRHDGDGGSRNGDRGPPDLLCNQTQSSCNKTNECYQSKQPKSLTNQASYSNTT